MKQINSTNIYDFISLFTGWKHEKLPYCTAGRPSYDQDVFDKHRETITVDFVWFGINSSITFKRELGGSTNFHWGVRDFGTSIILKIGDITIDVTEEKERTHYEYTIKVVSYSYTINKSRIKRVLSAIKEGKKPKFSSDKNNPDCFTYDKKYNRWFTITSIFDYSDGFVYIGKHRYEDDILFTYYSIHEDSLEK